MIRITATALIVGIAAGYLAGGRIRRLEHVRFSAGVLAFGALAVMVVESVADFGEPADRILVAAGYLLAAVFLAVNLRRHAGILRVAVAVLALGWVLNATVMVANGGMPLSLDAYAASGQTEAPTPGRGGFFKIVIADETTALRPLGDVIPLAPYRQVVSAGDLVLLAGLALALAAGMRTSAPVATTVPRRHLVAV